MKAGAHLWNRKPSRGADGRPRRRWVASGAGGGGLAPSARRAPGRDLGARRGVWGVGRGRAGEGASRRKGRGPGASCGGGGDPGQGCGRRTRAGTTHPPRRSCLGRGSVGGRWPVAGVCTDPSSRRTRAGQLPGPTERGGRAGGWGWAVRGCGSGLTAEEPGRGSGPGHRAARALPGGSGLERSPPARCSGRREGGSGGQGGAAAAQGRGRAMRKCRPDGRAGGRAGGALREGAVGPPPAGARAQPRGRSADR